MQAPTGGWAAPATAATAISAGTGASPSSANAAIALAGDHGARAQHDRLAGAVDERASAGLETPSAIV